MADVLITRPDPSAMGLRIRPFHRADADLIASWVSNELELKWLAPSTDGPLTPEKVVDWIRPQGRAYVVTGDDDHQPLGYGELNPMRNDRHHLWIGHLMVRPNQRGRGIGCFLAGELLSLSFGELGADRISLVVFPDNQAALRCYESAGFRNMGRERHQFAGRGPRHELIRMEARPPLDRASG